MSCLTQRLFKTALLGMKLGLKNVHKLDELLGFPSKKIKVIHVAGTNGKGSVSTKIAWALSLSGYKVGLYTSPHLYCFTERIKINGLNIPFREVEKGLSKLFKIIDEHKIQATFFEILTLLAFDYFAKKKVDFAVVETGLGGRLDATNIIDNPLVSVIISIGFDHTNLLGDTLEKIAFEKAGIIKPLTPVFIGPTAALNSIKERAKDLNCALHISQPIKGFYDLQNTQTAKNVLIYLKKKYHLSEQAIEKGLKKRPKCRFEIYTQKRQFLKFFKIFQEHKNPQKIPKALIFDVAHNAEGFENLFKTIVEKFSKTSIRVVFGISKGKDLKACSKIISCYAKHIHLIDSDHERLLKKEELALYFAEDQISFEKDLKATVKEAFEKAAKNKEVLVVCGSFFIMKDIKETFF